MKRNDSNYKYKIIMKTPLEILIDEFREPKYTMIIRRAKQLLEKEKTNEWSKLYVISEVKKEVFVCEFLRMKFNHNNSVSVFYNEKNQIVAKISSETDFVIK